MALNRVILFFLLLCFIFPLISYADQFEDAKAAIAEKNFIEAHKLLTPLAKENNVEAQTLLGALYVNGQGVEKDFEKGLSLIMIAAKQGFKDARIIAFKLNMDLGNQGNTTAMYNVGYMCLNGWGGETESDICLKWLENAAKMGHEKSALMLSRIFSKGMFGVIPDEEQATYWRKTPTESAMIIVDVQRAFTGNMCREQMEKMIPAINKLIDKFVKKNIDIIYIKQARSRGYEFDNRLKIVGNKIFSKPQDTSFSSREFIDYLRHNKIRHLYITGISAEECLSGTVYSALDYGYEVTVISDGIAARACSYLDKRLDEFKRLGAKIMLSEEL